MCLVWQKNSSRLLKNHMQAFQLPAYFRFFTSTWGLLVFCFLANACSSIPFVKMNKAPTRIFLTDYSTAWTAALEAVSAGRDVVKINNREAGIIETNWIDNSDSRQFLDVFADEHFFLRARYRFQVQVRQGKKNDQPAVMVRVLRFQQKETTFLGGWQEVESDGLEESVCLYRIGRLIAIQQFNEAEAKTISSELADD